MCDTDCLSLVLRGSWCVIVESDVCDREMEMKKKTSTQRWWNEHYLNRKLRRVIFFPLITVFIAELLSVDTCLAVDIVVVIFQFRLLLSTNCSHLFTTTRGQAALIIVYHYSWIPFVFDDDNNGFLSLELIQCGAQCLRWKKIFRRRRTTYLLISNRIIAAVCIWSHTITHTLDSPFVRVMRRTHWNWKRTHAHQWAIRSFDIWLAPIRMSHMSILRIQRLIWKRVFCGDNNHPAISPK